MWMTHSATFAVASHLTELPNPRPGRDVLLRSEIRTLLVVLGRHWWLRDWIEHGTSFQHCMHCDG